MKKVNVTKTDRMLMAFVVCLEEIENHEVSAPALQSTLATMLITMGYSKLEAVAAGMQATFYLKDIFYNEFYKTYSAAQRGKALLSAIKTAAMIIQEDKIDDDTRHRAAEAIRQAPPIKEVF